jgi:hypothetical protein
VKLLKFRSRPHRNLKIWPQPASGLNRATHSCLNPWRVKTEAGGDSTATSNVHSLIVDGSLPPVRIISINYLDQQVRIFWDSVETASKYRLQLSADPDFYPVIKEADIPGNTASLRLIPGKRYFVRLKALSNGPLGATKGVVHRLTAEQTLVQEA